MSRMLLRDCGRCGDLYTDMQNDLFALTNTMNSPGSEGGLIQMPEQMYDATANVKLAHALNSIASKRKSVLDHLGVDLTPRAERCTGASQ